MISAPYKTPKPPSKIGSEVTSTSQKVDQSRNFAVMRTPSDTELHAQAIRMPTLGKRKARELQPRYCGHVFSCLHLQLPATRAAANYKFLPAPSLSFDASSTPFSARHICLTPRCSMQQVLQQLRQMLLHPTCIPNYKDKITDRFI